MVAKLILRVVFLRGVEMGFSFWVWPKQGEEVLLFNWGNLLPGNLRYLGYLTWSFWGGILGEIIVVRLSIM